MPDPTTAELVHSIALRHSADGSEHWFAASTAGLRHSSDGGLSWDDCYESLRPQSSIATLAVAMPQNRPGNTEPDTGPDGYLLAGGIGGVLRSIDGGQTWSVFEAPAPPPAFTSLAFSPGFATDGLAFAGTLEDGVFRSEDRGRTWAAWNFGLLDLAVLDVAVTSPDVESRRSDNILFAATETGVFRSTNGGRAWRETGFSSDLSATICLAVSPAFATDQCLFAGTEADGLYRSNDGGDSWNRLSDPNPSGAMNTLILLPTPTRGPRSKPTPRQYRLLALVDDALHLSEDSGQSWNQVDLDQDLPDGISCVLIADDPARLTQTGGEAHVIRLLLGLHNGEVVAASFKASTHDNLDQG